jgi:CheY-like chemotaxis protein
LLSAAAIRRCAADFSAARLAGTRQIPVITLTAHAMAGDREKAMEVGREDYDTKPIEIARLLGKIAALLAARAV